MITKIIKLSLPIFLGGIIFNLTKVIINSMIVNAYGSFVLTFYGLEGLFFGVLTKYIASIQYAASTMTGQAMGSHKYKRAVKTYKYSLLIAVIAGLLNFGFFYVLRKPLSLVALDNNIELANMLIDFMFVYYVNAFCSPILEIVISYLNSLRITKPKLISDTLRTVILRLPLLAFLIYFTNFGYLSVALVYSVSNALTLIIMLIVSLVITGKIGKQVHIQDKLLLPMIRY